MKPTVHDDFEGYPREHRPHVGPPEADYDRPFERTHRVSAFEANQFSQVRALRSANESLHKRIAELEAERDALADELYVLKSRVQNLMAEAV